jgi:hypothetical protein
MIAQWVSSSRARLSLEANYLLLLQAVLTSLPAVEKEKKTLCVYLAAPFGHYFSTEKKVSVCGRVTSVCFFPLPLSPYFQFNKLKTDFLTFGIETYVEY